MEFGISNKMAIPTSHHLGGATLRALDKVLEDAHMTGILNLSGRNIRDFPKIADKFDLIDTLDVDISKNRFTEIPDEVCDYIYLERLNCYNNSIRVVPELFARLTILTYLNLSRNLLSVLPTEICEIYLEVLIVSNNKLVALPPEVGNMKTLMHLDASCNELDTLPMQIGEMESLKELNLRRNHLIHLPEEISRLNLIMLDVSCNKISIIPPSYRHIKTLDVLKLEHNPLEMPPAQVCTRGKVHIFKYLNNTATKDEKRRGMEQSERLSRLSYNNAKITWLTTHEAASRFGTAYSTTDQQRAEEKNSVVLSPSTLSAQYSKGCTNNSLSDNPLTPQSSIDSDSSNSTLCNGDPSVSEDFAYWNTKLGELRRGTMTADSGYDGDKRWSATEPPNEDEEARILAERANQQKEQRQQREVLLNQPLNQPLSSLNLDNEGAIDYIDMGEDMGEDGTEDSMDDGEITPTQLEPDEFTKALTRQKAQYDDQKQKAREERLRLEEQEKRRRQLQAKEETRRKAETRRRDAEHEKFNPTGSTLSLQANGSTKINDRRLKPLSSSSFSDIIRRPASLDISQSKRPTRRATVNISESLKANAPNRDSYNPSVAANHNNKLANGRLAPTDDSHRQLKRTSNLSSTSTSLSSLIPSSREGGISQTRHDAQLARRRQEEEKVRTKQIQKSAVRGFVQSRKTPLSPNSCNHEESEPSRESSPASLKSVQPPPPPTTYSGSTFGNIKPRSAFTISSGKPPQEVQPNFTVKREMSKYREEMDRIEHLRQLKPHWMGSYQTMLEIKTIENMQKCIETRLKVSLPDDVPAALEDGVVLCHFINNVFPHAVPTIHVPSPAVPKLTSAKCRRNVENFLKACSKAGIPEERMCTAADILEGKGLVKVAATVQTLLATNSTSQHKQSSVV